MAIRKFIHEQQPTELLVRRLHKCPTDRATYEVLCRRGQAGLADQAIRDGEEERALERMDADELTARAFTYDRELGSSDRVMGGLA